MATGQGSVTIDFGAFPGAQEAFVDAADAAVGAGSKVEAYVMADDTAGTHTAIDHRYFGQFAVFTAAPIAGVGVRIYARARTKMIGQFQLRYIWTD